MIDLAHTHTDKKKVCGPVAHYLMAVLGEGSKHEVCCYLHHDKTSSRAEPRAKVGTLPAYQFNKTVIKK